MNFLAFFWSKITPPIVLLIKIWAFSFNKVVSSIQFEFSFDFTLFLMFLSLTCCNILLFVSLFVGFCVDHLVLSSVCSSYLKY